MHTPDQKLTMTIDAALTTLAQASADRATIIAAIERAGGEPTDELIREIGEACSKRLNDILVDQLYEHGIEGSEARAYTDYRS